MPFESECKRKGRINCLPGKHCHTDVTLAVPTTRPMKSFPSSLLFQLLVIAWESCLLAELRTRSPSPPSLTVILIRTARLSRCWTAIAQSLPALEPGDG